MIRVDPKYRYLLKNTNDAHEYVNKVPYQNISKVHKSDADMYV